MENEHKTLKIACIGAGEMAHKIYFPALSQMDQVDIVSVCDRNPDKLASLREGYLVQNTYTDYRLMLDEITPDAVFAIGHPHTMYDVWTHCLKQGVNLFIEKPMGLNLHQAQSLAYLAKEHSCVTQVCFQRRASPLLQKLLTACKARGPITSASVEFFKNAPEPFTGARDHMFDDGVHAIDTLRHICEGEVVNIHSVTRRVGVPDINLMQVILEFSSGAVGLMHCNWTSGRRCFRVGMHAPSICAEADLEGKGYLFQGSELEGLEFDAIDAAGNSEKLHYCGFYAKIQEFLSCLQSGDRPSSDFSDALKTHIIAEKVLARAVLDQA